MTREEIISYIEYNGKYTKDVKKKLNKLIKKYHPDRNKSDKTTILTLYSIKKELESNKTIDTKKSTEVSKEEYVQSDIQNDISFATPLIERILKILKKKKRFIESNLKSIYRREFYYNNKIYKDSYNIGLLDLKIKELNNKQQKLKKINKYDYFLLILFISLIVLSFKYHFLVFFIVVPILFELLYLNYRSTIYYENSLLIENIKEKKKTENTIQKSYYDNLSRIKKEELLLKQEKRTVNNDIAFYNHELSKNNEYSKVNKSRKGSSYAKK